MEQTWAGSRVELVPLAANLVDALWADAQPAEPREPVRVQSVERAGTSVADKLALVRRELAAKRVAALAVAALDEVAWLFNVRGRCVRRRRRHASALCARD